MINETNGFLRITSFFSKEEEEGVEVVEVEAEAEAEDDDGDDAADGPLNVFDHFSSTDK